MTRHGDADSIKYSKSHHRPDVGGVAGIRLRPLSPHSPAAKTAGSLVRIDVFTWMPRRVHSAQAASRFSLSIFGTRPGLRHMLIDAKQEGVAMTVPARPVISSFRSVHFDIKVKALCKNLTMYANIDWQVPHQDIPDAACSTVRNACRVSYIG